MSLNLKQESAAHMYWTSYTTCQFLFGPVEILPFSLVVVRILENVMEMAGTFSIMPWLLVGHHPHLEKPVLQDCLAVQLALPAASFSLRHCGMGLRMFPWPSCFKPHQQKECDPDYTSSGSVKQLYGRQLEVFSSRCQDHTDVATISPLSLPFDVQRNLTANWLQPTKRKKQNQEIVDQLEELTLCSQLDCWVWGAPRLLNFVKASVSSCSLPAWGRRLTPRFHPIPEKKECHQKQGALREQLQVHIQTAGSLVSEKAQLQTALAHRQHASRQKEGESEDLASSLQYSWQHVGELEWALFAFTTQQKKADRVIPTTCPVRWQPGFSDGGVSLKVPSAGWSVLPRRQHGPFLAAFLCVC
ncbi:uncharacterized protein LOC119466700 [Cebus imitator]|uniref:uncharacterized protein LOC119466700 n=1 Tax=Cebus imitator TaxID=2715852 RepID=UPI0018978A9A|nr:uncharacterized protein LOC119466700 [Cebus imitator]